MSSIEEMFKTYADYGNIPVIGIINWNSKLSPDANVCIVFIFNYVVIAFSAAGNIFRSHYDNPKWIKT